MGINQEETALTENGLEFMKNFLFLLMFLPISLNAEPLTKEVQEFEKAFQQAVRSAYTQEFGVSKADNSIRNISRTEILERAYRALNLRFYYARENHTRSGTPNDCSLSRQNYWARPDNLNDKAETEITSVPYKWGGYFRRIEQFEDALASNKLAGDVCTCRRSEHNYCIVPESTGLDCSGFISFAWNIPYHTTSSMHEISTNIDWYSLREGDAINRRGRHILLFLSYTSASRTDVRVLESSLTCRGVCESVHSVSDLQGKDYQPIRFDGAID